MVYPPAFQAVLKAAGDGFKATCPRADDVWLHAQALRHGVQVRQARERSVHFVEVIGTQRSALNRSNVKSGGNDEQIRATYSQEDLQQLRRARSAETAIAACGVMSGQGRSSSARAPWRRATTPDGSRMRKSCDRPQPARPSGTLQGLLMDIELINALGARLSDLARRTTDLRGYL